MLYAVAVGLPVAAVRSAGSRAASTEPGAVRQRTPRPSSLVSWRTSPPNYTADTVSSMTLRAGHAGRHSCAAGRGDAVVVCSRFRKSPTPSSVVESCECSCCKRWWCICISSHGIISVVVYIISVVVLSVFFSLCPMHAVHFILAVLSVYVLCFHSYVQGAPPPKKKRPEICVTAHILHGAKFPLAHL